MGIVSIKGHQKPFPGFNIPKDKLRFITHISWWYVSCSDYSSKIRVQLLIVDLLVTLDIHVWTTWSKFMFSHVCVLFWYIFHSKRNYNSQLCFSIVWKIDIISDTLTVVVVGLKRMCVCICMHVCTHVHCFSELYHWGHEERSFCGPVPGKTLLEPICYCGW